MIRPLAQPALSEKIDDFSELFDPLLQDILK